MKNRKGDAVSIILAFITLFLISIVLLFSGSFAKKIFTVFGDSPEIQANELSSGTIRSANEGIIGLSNGMFFILLVSVLLFLIFGAIYTNFNPAFFVIFIFIAIAGVFITWHFGDMYSGLLDSGIVEEGEGMVIQKALFSRYTAGIFFILAVVIAVIMYGNRGQAI